MEKRQFLQNEVNIILKNFGLQNVIYLWKPPWVFLNFNLGGYAGYKILISQMLNEGILIQGIHNICDALSNKDINKIIKSYKIV